MAPGEFIPFIEHMAIATPTTTWVLDTAVAQLARWREAGHDLTVSTNVLATNLHRSNPADKVKAPLARHALRPSSSELELTETAVASHAASAAAPA